MKRYTMSFSTVDLFAYIRPKHLLERQIKLHGSWLDQITIFITQYQSVEADLDSIFSLGAPPMV